VEDLNDLIKKTDVWSFGMTLSEIIRERPPYPAGIQGPQLMYAVASGKLPFKSHDFPRDTPRVISQVTMECLQKDENKRPFFKDVLAQVEEYYKTQVKQKMSSAMAQLYQRL